MKIFRRERGHRTLTGDEDLDERLFAVTVEELVSDQHDESRDEVSLLILYSFKVKFRPCWWRISLLTLNVIYKGILVASYMWALNAVYLLKKCSYYFFFYRRGEGRASNCHSAYIAIRHRYCLVQEISFFFLILRL